MRTCATRTLDHELDAEPAGAGVQLLLTQAGAPVRSARATAAGRGLGAAGRGLGAAGRGLGRAGRVFGGPAGSWRPAGCLRPGPSARVRAPRTTQPCGSRARRPYRRSGSRAMIEPMSGIGLVLGAGGVVGQAYHAGVLAMLEHDVGWDPRKADVIVGTSAGSITGALLRAGVPASELAAWTVRAPLSAEGGLLHRLVGADIPEFPPFRPLHALKRRPDLPGWEMLLHAAVRPRHFRPGWPRSPSSPPGSTTSSSSWGCCVRSRGSRGPSATSGSARSAGVTAGGSSSVGREPGRPAAPRHRRVVCASRLLRPGANRSRQLHRRRRSLTHERSDPA